MNRPYKSKRVKHKNKLKNSLRMTIGKGIGSRKAKLPVNTTTHSINSVKVEGKAMINNDKSKSLARTKHVKGRLTGVHR